MEYLKVVQPKYKHLGYKCNRYEIYVCWSPTAFNQNIGSWNTSSVTTMIQMFRDARAFNNGGSNSINNWDTSSVSAMTYMFGGAGVFNQDIGNWDTSNVTAINNMFQSATAFNQDIGNWNTSNVTTMSYTFYRAQMHSIKIFLDGVCQYTSEPTFYWRKIINMETRCFQIT